MIEESRQHFSRATSGALVLLAAACVVIAIQAVVIANRRAARPGDFDVNREMGRRFLAGENLYAGGQSYNHTPTAALFFAPFAVIPPGAGLILRYTVAIGALILTLNLLAGMNRGRASSAPAPQWPLAAATVALGSHYVIRDLDDGGPHLILLALLMTAISLAAKGQEGWSAGLFGLLATLKASFAIFLPFLFFKRRTRLACLALAAALLWTLLPVLRMGPAAWLDHQTSWARNALASVIGRPADGAPENELRSQNQALRQSVMRLSAAVPAEAFPASPERIADASVLAVAAGFLWLARRRYSAPDDPLWFVETGALAILAVLLAPIAWIQHMVVALPAIYLILASDRFPPSDHRVVWGLGAYAFGALALNREFLGREVYLGLLAGGLHTLCLLILLGLLWGRRARYAEAVPPASLR